MVRPLSVFAVSLAAACSWTVIPGMRWIRSVSSIPVRTHMVVSQPTLALQPSSQATVRTEAGSRTLLALLLITLSACGRGDVGPASNTADEFLRTASDLVDSTVSEPFGPPDLIARPLEMVASRTYLFITDIKPPYVHVLDMITGEHTRSFGLQGEGPGDFPSTPLLVAGSTRGDTAWFYQVTSGRLSGVAVRDLSADTLPSISATRAFNPGSGWIFALDGPDTAGNLLGMTEAPDGIQAFTYSLPGDSLITRGTLALIDDRIDPSSFGQAYQGILCYVPERDVWLQFYRDAGRTDIIDVTGAIRGEVLIPFHWLPHVEESTKKPGRMIFSAFLARTRHAYAGCAVTERFVYGLYLGHLTGDRGAKHYFDRLPLAEVHVFDMSFNLVKTFVLDHAALVLAVPPGDTVLFTVKEDSTGAQVRRTRLP